MIDIVEFAETMCDMKLLDYQKTFLRTIYEHRKNKKLAPMIGRRSASMRLLDAEMMCIFYDEFISESEGNDYEVEVINRGNCMMCGKELDEDEGLFFCKECEEKAHHQTMN